MNGQVLTAAFDFTLLQSFFDADEIEETYVLNGERLEFTVPEVTLQPPVLPAPHFVYSALLIDGSPLPSDFIKFDETARQFTIQSSDQSLDEVYNITVTAASLDTRWTTG